MARVKKYKQRNILMKLMLAPYLFLLIAFGLVPLLMAVREVPGESLTNPDGGWDAFKIVVQDFRFPQAVKNVLGFMAIYVPLTLVLVIVMALMLDVRHIEVRKYLCILHELH